MSDLLILTKEECQQAISGQMVRAIKSVRERTGTSIPYAKAAIDRYLHRRSEGES